MSWNATSERPLIMLYDGTCRFCIAGKDSVMRMAKPGAIVPVNGKDPAELARFPQVSAVAMNRALQLVSPEGELAIGAEAVNRALATRPVWRLVTWVYWLPGLHALCDWAYALVAKNRYRIAGSVSPCDDGACEIPSKRSNV